MEMVRVLQTLLLKKPAHRHLNLLKERRRCKHHSPKMGVRHQTILLSLVVVIVRVVPADVLETWGAPRKKTVGCQQNLGVSC